ncbi:protein SWOLLEN 1-like isoform X2 [Coffea arabica]|uniref:Protein SWOLLEN 1-like isoform X2 n=1 Tax=Coffea arabica TaxID=13443 RepID=A0ABM4U1M1_COFAR
MVEEGPKANGTGSCQLKQLEVTSVERSGAKQGVVLPISGSSLPDLNTSAQVSLFFQQPFTDLQQLQLRVQIFVYGSLIQGVAPDEACMVSTFGMCEGGRSFWEPAWRAYLERLHGPKLHPGSSETPVQSRSGFCTRGHVGYATVLDHCSMNNGVLPMMLTRLSY